jgi:hypothetical protein
MWARAAGCRRLLFLAPQAKQCGIGDLSVFHNRRDNAARGAYIVTICLRYFFHRAEAIVCAEVDIAKSCA